MKVRINKLEGYGMDEVGSKLEIGKVYEANYVDGLTEPAYAVPTFPGSSIDWWLHPDDITVIED